MTTILAIENDDAIAALLEEYLSILGYSVRITRYGQGVRPVLDADPVPDVILLDLIWPYPHGREVMGGLKGHPRLSAVPVILISAIPGLDRHAALLRVDDYIPKPFDLEDLLQKVNKWANRGEENPPSSLAA